MNGELMFGPASGALWWQITVHLIGSGHVLMAASTVLTAEARPFPLHSALHFPQRLLLFNTLALSCSFFSASTCRHARTASRRPAPPSVAGSCFCILLEREPNPIIDLVLSSPRGLGRRLETWYGSCPQWRARPVKHYTSQNRFLSCCQEPASHSRVVSRKKLEGLTRNTPGVSSHSGGCRKGGCGLPVHVVYIKFACNHVFISPVTVE
jgi:hypothetical protein